MGRSPVLKTPAGTLTIGPSEALTVMQMWLATRSFVLWTARSGAVIERSTSCSCAVRAGRSNPTVDSSVTNSAALLIGLGMVMPRLGMAYEQEADVRASMAAWLATTRNASQTSSNRAPLLRMWRSRSEV
eukprot:scaffold6310_cov67-Phaeocystis_antarctica.AAC.3